MKVLAREIKIGSTFAVGVEGKFKIVSITGINSDGSYKGLTVKSDTKVEFTLDNVKFPVYYRGENGPYMSVPIYK